jgi:methyltransferase family protein
VSNTKRAEGITGEISASPNPVYFGQGPVLISWRTNDASGTEVRVLTSQGGEKVVCKSRKPSGQTEIAWIVDSAIYDFRLFGNSQPDAPLDSVLVRRAIDSAPMALQDLAAEASRGNIDLAELSNFVATVIPDCFHSPHFQQFFGGVLRELAKMREKIDVTELSQFIATVVPHCLFSKEFRQSFLLWERTGFHVTPVHFYQPIPDTQHLPEKLWTQPSELAGFDMNESMQLDFLRKQFPGFRNEYERFPIEPTEESRHLHLNNGLFGGIDALVAYCMVRLFQPRLIIEIGSGYSSLFLGEAAAKNTKSALICVEPFPQEFLKSGFPGLNRLIEKKVEDIDIKFFSDLHSGDILFIDSSHTVKIGGDVNYLFLEVLPRLKPGVIVHIHDIFLPFEYRRDWVLDEFRFWSEQYLLQAFLTFNSEFEVLMANSYMAHRYPDDLKAAFPSLERLKKTFPNSAKWGGGSFWMRRKSLRGQVD